MGLFGPRDSQAKVLTSDIQGSALLNLSKIGEGLFLLTKTLCPLGLEFWTKIKNDPQWADRGPGYSVVKDLVERPSQSATADCDGAGAL